jgi:hypothetical protein
LLLEDGDHLLEAIPPTTASVLAIAVDVDGQLRTTPGRSCALSAFDSAYFGVAARARSG